VLGSVFWKDIALWVAVPTNVVCGFLLPISYVAFTVMHKKRAYLKDDLPTGPMAQLWIAGMALATTVLVAFLGWFAINEVPSWIEKITP